MNENLLKIAIISNENKRIQSVKASLRQAQAAFREFAFKDISLGNINVAQFDLVIFDCASSTYFDLKEFYHLREENHKSQTPYLILLNENQLDHRQEIFRDERSGFIKDPYEHIEFLSITRYLISLGQLEKKVFLYNDVLASEKKIIYYLDSILQIPALSSCRSEEEFYYVLQQEFAQRMELTFSVESVIFLKSLNKSDSLIFQKYGKNLKDIQSRSVFNIKGSRINSAFLENNPVIFEKQSLLDSFAQELEEAVGVEIHSLLFAPFVWLKQRQGGFALINKSHRKSFSENDLALSMITQQKFMNQLENLLLRFKNTNLITMGQDTVATSDKSSGEHQQKFFRGILDKLKFGVIIFDPKTNVIFMNQFADNVLNVRNTQNLKLEQVLGREALSEIKKILSGRDLPELRQEMQVIIDLNRTLYIGYSVYDISDKDIKHYAMTFLEISQTKRLQAEIIRMDRMASLGVLASGIAHEIRNPLAGIKAMAQTLEEELEGDKSRIEYVQRIVRQVNRLDALLKSFFSYAKPQRPNPVRCHIPDIVHEVLPLFLRKIKENNIEVKEEYSQDLKEIFVDFHQIEQVIFNLVINAIDAMENGGILTIKAHLPEETQVMIDRRQRIPKLFSNVYNQIIISDTGTGMDSNILNNMYNPFYTTKSYGTGLGLSIVYQIILEHGGQITVESEEGKGTSFKILLPVFMHKDDV